MIFNSRYILSFFLLFFFSLTLNRVDASYLSLDIPEGVSVKSIKIDYRSSSPQINEVIEFSKKENIYSLGINAKVEFLKKESYSRFLLIDSNYNEYLIYESSPVFVNSNQEEIKYGGDETSDLSKISIIGIRVLSEFCAIKIDDLIYIDEPGPAQRRSFSDSMNDKMNKKVERLNSVLRSQNSLWVAGDTPIARMSYEEKKVLFGGKVPNTYGFEFYKGGIFSIPSTDLKTPQSNITPKASLYADEFTWENRHGKNWLTSVKEQGECGGCWAFAVAAATELMVNLYFNQQINLDLSEQDLISCSGAGDCIEGGLPGEAIDYIISRGVVDESCFSYRAANSSCGYKCENPLERITVGQKRLFNSTDGSEDDLKDMIIKGPVTSGVYDWEHAVAMVGYKTLKPGDEILVNPSFNDNWVTIDSSSSYVGKTAWRIKNSWGRLWGDNGYAYIVTNISNIEWTWGIEGGVTSLKYSDSDIKCVDEDKDGYYTWGLGAKPETCPPCSDEQDGDDSNPGYGPMDNYGNLTQISNYIRLIAPTDDLIYQSPNTIELAADAYITSGSIIKVEFYVDNNLVDSDDTPPYNGTWTSPSFGRHEIYAKVISDSQPTLDSQKTGVIVSGELGEGSISRYVYKNISGGDVDDLTSNYKFPYSPDLEDEIDIFQIPLNYSINYGTRISGYIHPPLTGSYRFYISGSESAQLFLSLDEQEINKTKIAEIYNGSSHEQWDKELSQESKSIYLETGKKYFIESLQKDDFGIDHLSAGWQIPGGNDIEVIKGAFLSTYFKEALEEYEVFFLANENGLVKGDLTQSIIAGGTTSKVRAVPSKGYYFQGWSGDYTGAGKDLILYNVRSDKTIYADFKIKEFTISFFAGANGSIDGLTTQTIKYGNSSSLITAVPDSGYDFAGWIGDYTGTEKNLVLENISSNMTIKALFIKEGASPPIDENLDDTVGEDGDGDAYPDSNETSSGGGGGCFIESMF